MFSKPIPTLSEPTLPLSNLTMAQRQSSGTEEVRSKRESAEYRAFRNCFSVLADGITDPGRLAVQLFSKELIGPDLRKETQKQAIEERVKIVMLLSAVEDQIVASPVTKFREFLDVLQSEPSLQHLATRLENTYRELCTPSASRSMSAPSSQHLTTCIQPNSPSLENTHRELLGQCVGTQPSPPLPIPCQQPQHPSLGSDANFLPPTKNFRQDHLGYPLTHSSSQFPPSAVDTYASYLKFVYTREKLPVYDKWPQVKSKKYINLALIEKEDLAKQEIDQFTRATIHGNIDDIKKSKRAIQIDQVAKLPDGSQPRCILVEGAPGIGKSTFAWKLCHKWGKGKLLQQYQLVVLLRLRDKSMRTAKNISDLFRYHRHLIQQAAVEDIQDTGGEGVLLLFEGFDELPEELRTENSVFLDIITGTELPEATVLITSRPWASEFLHRECKGHISQHIEILGFTTNDIQSYLKSTTADDPTLLEGLKKYISCYPHINSLMYIPLNSAIVVEVYRNSRKDKTLVPKTMTELYSSLVRSLLLRYLYDHPVHGKKRRWRICSFNDLPQDVHQQLCNLGRIAYEGILHDQQVIFSDLPEDFETLGLMQCAPELYLDEGATLSYNFLHLTVQEYLAAFHLSQQPVQKQVNHFHGSTGENKHFHNILHFLSGVGKFTGYSNFMLDTLCPKCRLPRDWPSILRMRNESDDESDEEFDFGIEFGDDSASVVCKVTFDILHWLFEAQDNDVIAKLLGSPDIQLHPPDDVVTPFDCFVLGYCVSHSNYNWRIGVWRPNSDWCVGDEGVEMLVQGAVEEETHCTGGISWLDLSGNGITSESVKHLLNLPRQMINKLETLVLDDNHLTSEVCVLLAHLIPHVPYLKLLVLSGNPNIGNGGTVPLLISLTQAAHSLEAIDLSKTGIGVEDCRALSELLSSSTSLKWLAISENDLPPGAIELIIHHSSTLTKLYMNSNCFSLQNTISLASVLKTNCTLVHLDLGQCNINSDGACELVSALHANNTLQELGLNDNPVGVVGATALTEMLLMNTSLKKLDLRDDSIGEEGTQKLIDSLTHNTTLEKLFLPGKYEFSITSSKVDSGRVKF